jgi:hypothetical protein
MHSSKVLFKSEFNNYIRKAIEAPYEASFTGMVHNDKCEEDQSFVQQNWKGDICTGSEHQSIHRTKIVPHPDNHKKKEHNANNNNHKGSNKHAKDKHDHNNNNNKGKKNNQGKKSNKGGIKKGKKKKGKKTNINNNNH